MNTRFRRNSSFHRDLARDAGVRAAMVGQVEQVKAIAERGLARIMPSQSDALEVELDEDGVRLVNTDHGGHLTEWGSAKNPPKAPLRRAVREAGLRLQEHDKA